MYKENVKEATELQSCKKKILLLMYLADIKIFAKNEKELETMIQTIRIFSRDKEMEFGIENVACLKRKKEKQLKLQNCPIRKTSENLEKKKKKKKSTNTRNVRSGYHQANRWKKMKNAYNEKRKKRNN